MSSDYLYPRQRFTEGEIGRVVTVPPIVDELGVPIDISGATTKVIKFRNRIVSSATLTRAAAFVTDGSDGELEVATVAGDLTAPEVEAQGEVTMPGGEVYRTARILVTVDPAI